MTHNLSAGSLLSSSAIRLKANRMLADAQNNLTEHWRVDLSKLPKIAEFVTKIISSNYPKLNIPIHSRWRHFDVGQIDRWARIKNSAKWKDKISAARAAFDLTIISVLLDAGSGKAWSYREIETKKEFRSSEGLGVASINLFKSGILSSKIDDPFRVDAKKLIEITTRELAFYLQVTKNNPLIGVEGRLNLLNKLGFACQKRPDIFAVDKDCRPGGLADIILMKSANYEISSDLILEIILDALGPIWPNGLLIDQIALGDAWIYPRWKLDSKNLLECIVPFHKLSQWLTYSLIEPIQDMGIKVTNLNRLTGLAEYRNGGLFVDGGVLILTDKRNLSKVHSIADSLIIEWRALTLALLDILHPMVANNLGVNIDNFSLACLLEGGTWFAGRQIARNHRADGSPPLLIKSDGTTF
jgi:Protein of unknown function (DUF1688)